MNPRVSRSSALASKATGFPIAKIAAKLAIGYTLDEIPNDITLQDPGGVRAGARLRGGEDPAVRVREVPRRRPGADHHDEVGRRGDEPRPQLRRGAEQGDAVDGDQGGRVLDRAGPGRRRRRGDPGRAADPARRPALHGRAGAAARRVGRPRSREASGGIDPWFLDQIAGAGRAARRDRRRAGARRARCCAGPSGPASPTGSSPRCARSSPARTGCAPCGTGSGVRPVYKTVDTCAAEFAADHAVPLLVLRRGDRGRAVGPAQGADPRLRAEPDRAGHRVRLLLRARGAWRCAAVGYETVMVNCNPETVSTDYDTADRLYFEPLTFEDVLEVCHAEDASGEAAGGPGRGRRDRAARRADPARAWRSGSRTPACRSSAPRPESIHLAEDRGAFGAVLAQAGLRAPAHGTATSFDEAKAIADEIGYPVLVRPSYVLGGRGMEIVYDDADAARLHRPGHRDLAGPPGAGRPVPRRRDRDRRGRALRRRPARSTSAA